MNQFGLRTHSIWQTQKCCPKRRVFAVVGVYSNVTCIIYVLGAEGHSDTQSVGGTCMAVGLRSREYAEQSWPPSQRQGPSRSQEEAAPAERVSWGWKAPRGGMENNSPECCQPASATRAVIWGWGCRVTRGPPEGWVEALGEEPRTPPLWAAAEGCSFYSWASCRCECSEARWARAPRARREWQKQKPLEKHLDSRSWAQFPNIRGFPFAGIAC